RSGRRHDRAPRPDPRPHAGEADAPAARRGHRHHRVHDPQGACARPGPGGERPRVDRAAPVSALRAFSTRARAKRWTVAAASLAARWGAVGSLSGAGVVGLLGASVSSLTHCGLGSFGVLLAVAGVSATTLQWFGNLEPVLIPAGYALIVLAIVARARGLDPAWS